MVVTPEIRAAIRTASAEIRAVQIDLVIPKDLSYFDGHFPSCALLPGVVQTNWAIEFARHYLDVSGEFLGIADLKFMRVIQPGDTVQLHLSFEVAKARVIFEYRRDVGVCASGAVQFRA